MVEPRQQERKHTKNDAVATCSQSSPVAGFEVLGLLGMEAPYDLLARGVVFGICETETEATDLIKEQLLKVLLCARSLYGNKVEESMKHNTICNSQSVSTCFQSEKVTQKVYFRWVALPRSVEGGCSRTTVAQQFVKQNLRRDIKVEFVGVSTFDFVSDLWLGSLSPCSH